MWEMLPTWNFFRLVMSQVTLTSSLIRNLNSSVFNLWKKGREQTDKVHGKPITYNHDMVESKGIEPSQNCLQSRPIHHTLERPQKRKGYFETALSFSKDPEAY